MTAVAARPISKRLGFSLVELLIVLAILATIAALVVPSLRRNFQRNELRDATRQLQESLGELRLEALQSGRPLWVQFGWDSANLRVSRDGAWDMARQRLAAPARSAGGSANLDSSATLGLPPASSGDTASLAGEAAEIRVPIDARFAARRQFRDRGTSPPAGDSNRGPVSPDPATASAVPSSLGADSDRNSGPTQDSGSLGGPTTWSRPIAIRPDGSVDEFHFWLQLEGLWQCPILWRGSTGQLEIGPFEVVTDSISPSSTLEQP